MQRYANDPRSELVFTAEMRVRDLNLTTERKFANLTEIREYLTTVQSRAWAWPAAQWQIKVDQHNLQTANYRNGIIFVPQLPVLFTMAARELVILHEFAHHCAGVQHNHDHAFVTAFLDLVHGMLPTAAEPLQREFDREGVRYARQP